MNFSPVLPARCFFLAAALLLPVCGGRGLRAQVPGNFDPTYQPPVLDQGAQVVAIDPVVVNGQTVYDTLLGGSFTTFNGASVNPLIRLNADGTLDTTFASSAGILVPRENADVNALLVQPDGKIVAAAYGTTDAQATLTRLNADGTLDPNFTTTLPDGAVMAMAIQPADSKIVIAGNFYTVDGTAVTGLTRLNPDGSIDTSFIPAPAPVNGSGTYLIQAGTNVLIQPDGKIVVAGTINTTAGVVYAIVRLNADGSQDTAFSPVLPDSGNSFQALGLQTDGQLIAAGNVASIGGVAVPNIARFSGVDGSLDQSFAVGLALGAGINQLAVQADGKILLSNDVGGGTTLTRLNADGSLDRDYAPGFVLNESTVTALALQPDGLAVVSGTLVPPEPAANQPNVSVARLLANAATGLTTVSVIVPGNAKVWLAANGAVDQDGFGDSVANAEPVRATGLALTSGATLTFSATGLVNNSDGNPASGPDGDGESEGQPSENGLSGVTAPGDSLIAVFIDDSAPDPTNANAPAVLDFSGSATGVPGGTDYTTLSPLLGQVFFIGDGQTSAGVTQQVTVPAGATHLVFGTMDYGLWHDNSGGFSVTVNASAGPVSVPLTATTLAVSGASTGAVVPKGTPLTFTATQGAVSPNIYVRVQATQTPTVESSWTDISDTTNGGAGFLANQGNGTYTLTSDLYPSGRIYFRAISAEPGQPDSISTPAVGYFDLTNANAPSLRITQSASTPDDPNANVAIIGDQITYTLNVYNDGPQTATGLKIIEALPSHLQLISADYSYTSDSSNNLTFIVGTLAPTGNQPLQIHITAAVTSDAVVGEVLTNAGYSVSADDTGIVQGTVRLATTVVRPLEVVVTSNSTSVSPGQLLIFRVDVINRTSATAKQVSLSIPLPGALLYQPTINPAYFEDGNNQAVTSPATKDGSLNPTVSNGNLLAYFGNIKANSAMHLHVTLQVPYDIDPAASVTLDSPQVTSKTVIGDSNNFTVPGVTVALSGASPATEPQLSFAKVLIDANNLLQLGLLQPKLAKQLNTLLLTVAANPALVAQFSQVYPGLAGLTPATATINQLLTAINPDMGYSVSDIGGGTVTTVNEPSSKKAETYLAFALAYTNTGGASAPSVTITDLVPQGTSILDASGNYNGSVIVNGKPGVPGSNMTISTDANNVQTLSFNIGTIKTGGIGVILYKVRLLTAGEAGAPTSGTLLSTSGSNLTSPLLSHQHIGQPDGENVAVVGKYAYFYQSTTPTGGSTTLSDGVTYDIYYKNTGSRASKILEIDDPIPAGLQYLGCEILDANHQSYSVPANAVEVPPAQAGQQYPTNGTLVFHPPLFNASGKVKPAQNGEPADSGYIREYFYPTPTALADGHTVFVHSPRIADSSYDVTSRAVGGPIPRGVSHGPVPRDAGAATPSPADSYTQVADPSLSRVFVVSAVPMTMVEGQQAEIFVAEGSLDDKALLTGSVNFVLPPALQYVSDDSPGLIGTQQQTDSAGNTVITIGFDFTPVGQLTGIQGHTARFAKITVQPKAGTASATPLVLPNCYILPNGSTTVALQTGPINTRILTAAESNAFSALKAQVAGNILSVVNPGLPQLQEFVDNIGLGSRTIALAGASGVSHSNGVLMVPMLGSTPQALAIGPSSGLAGDGTTTSLYSAGLDFLMESGPSTGIIIGPFPVTNSTPLPAQTGSKILDDITSGASGSLLKQDQALLLNLGGNNLIGQDGNGLIGQDGNGAVATVPQVVSNDGGSLAAGRSNTDGIISQDGNGLISQDGNGLLPKSLVISNDGGSIVAAGGGNIVAAGGGNIVAQGGGNVIGENSSGLVGSPNNSAAFHASASGNLIQGGSASGVIGENSSGFTGTTSAAPAKVPGKKKR